MSLLAWRGRLSVKSKVLDFKVVYCISQGCEEGHGHLGLRMLFLAACHGNSRKKYSDCGSSPISSAVPATLLITASHSFCSLRDCLSKTESSTKLPTCSLRTCRKLLVISNRHGNYITLMIQRRMPCHSCRATRQATTLVSKILKCSLAIL
jgi:hypothetical protein